MSAHPPDESTNITMKLASFRDHNTQFINLNFGGNVAPENMRPGAISPPPPPDAALPISRSLLLLILDHRHVCEVQVQGHIYRSQLMPLAVQFFTVVVRGTAPYRLWQVVMVPTVWRERIYHAVDNHGKQTSVVRGLKESWDPLSRAMRKTHTSGAYHSYKKEPPDHNKLQLNEIHRGGGYGAPPQSPPSRAATATTVESWKLNQLWTEMVSIHAQYYLRTQQLILLVTKLTRCGKSSESCIEVFKQFTETLFPVKIIEHKDVLPDAEQRPRNQIISTATGIVNDDNAYCNKPKLVKAYQKVYSSGSQTAMYNYSRWIFIRFYENSLKNVTRFSGQVGQGIGLVLDWPAYHRYIGGRIY
uniref:Uncharacterized protein n=1 Tax=Timema bartmani TaxID=61472 RepID=A0A7R9ESW8_9NEOP|nr:unnamed protein product [Timema bartmani]